MKYIVVNTFSDMGGPAYGQEIVGFADSVTGLEILIERDRKKGGYYMSLGDYDIYVKESSAYEFFIDKPAPVAQ